MMLSEIAFIVAIVWLILQARELYSTIVSFEPTKRLRFTLRHIWSCSKCLSFWAGLLLTRDPIVASLASLAMACVGRWLYVVP